jgi:hypothetical protein
MRIVSDSRDYYDCLQSTDEDKKTLWVRQLKQVTFQKKEQYPLPVLAMPWGEPMIVQHIIGFCGKIYPWLEVSTYQGSRYGESRATCRSAADVERFIRSNFDVESVQSYVTSTYLRHRIRGMRRIRDVLAFFEECRVKERAFMKLFEEYRTPVFVGCYNPPGGDIPHIEFNALLRKFEFFRLFPPAQAYQEISMFMCNLAVPIKPIPKLDDVTMAQVKGFDRFSFRKDATRKRKR